MDKNETSQKEIRRTVMAAALVLIILLILLSIFGAFLGSERAKMFFNSFPLSLYWSAFTAFLLAAFSAFPRLLRLPGLLLLHAGCVLVLAGSMWASPAAHNARNRLLGIDKIHAGEITIAEGQSENLVTIEGTDQTKQLPFYIKLNDFRIEYYTPEYLQIQTAKEALKIPVEIGTTFFLGDDLGSITIVRKFDNFKITINGDSKTIIDDPRAGYNPALQLQIQNPDGTTYTTYVFERFPRHFQHGDKFIFTYQKNIRDYISDIEVIKDGKVVAEKSIEVNYPLHFGGYHFYQSSYDADAHTYTVLSVVSDTGLNLVYAGYIMLGTGVIWHFWLRNTFTKNKSKSK